MKLASAACSESTFDRSLDIVISSHRNKPLFLFVLSVLTKFWVMFHLYSSNLDGTPKRKNKFAFLEENYLQQCKMKLHTFNWSGRRTWKFSWPFLLIKYVCTIFCFICYYLLSVWCSLLVNVKYPLGFHRYTDKIFFP